MTDYAAMKPLSERECAVLAEHASATTARRALEVMRREA